MNARLPCLVILITITMQAAAVAQPARRTPRSTRGKQAAAVKQKAPDLPAVEQGITERANKLRSAQDLPALEVDPQLAKAAVYFASYMAANNKYGHTADEKTLTQRAEEHGYKYCLVLENIAYQYDSAGIPTDRLIEEFAGGWERSPPHRENLLHPHVTQTAVAIAQSKKTQYYYAVQLFGRPRSSEFEFTIKNETGQTLVYRIAKESFELPPRHTMTHQRCLPSKLEFQELAPATGQAAESSSKKSALVLDISQSGHWLVKIGAGGKLTAGIAPAK